MTDREKEKIYNDYVKAGRIKDVAHKHNLSTKQVAGIIGAYIKSNKPDMKNLFLDYLRGLSVDELATKYDRSKSFIRTEIRKKKFNKDNIDDVYEMLIDEYISGVDETFLCEKYLFVDIDSLRNIITKKQPQVEVNKKIREFETQIDGKQHSYKSFVGIFKIITTFVVVTERYVVNNITKYSVLPDFLTRDMFNQLFNGREIMSYSIDIYRDTTNITLRGKYGK